MSLLPLRRITADTSVAKFKLTRKAHQILSLIALCGIEAFRRKTQGKMFMSRLGFVKLGQLCRNMVR